MEGASCGPRAAAQAGQELCCGEESRLGTRRGAVEKWSFQRGVARACWPGAADRRCGGHSAQWCPCPPPCLEVQRPLGSLEQGQVIVGSWCRCWGPVLSGQEGKSGAEAGAEPRTVDIHEGFEQLGWMGRDSCLGRNWGSELVLRWSSL